MYRNKGKPALAPRHYKAPQVEPSFMHLALKVAMTHEGHQHDTVRNLRQGPQHLCRSDDARFLLPVPACLDAVMPRIHIAQCLRLTRQGEPVTAPAQRQSCQCVLPIPARMGVHKGSPSTARYRDDAERRRRKHQANEDRCPCLQYHGMSALQVRCHSPSAASRRCKLVQPIVCQHVLQSYAGLSRTEPLISFIESPLLCGTSALSRHPFKKVRVNHCQATDAGAERPRRSSPRRYPRSRVVRMGPGDGHRPRLRPDAKPSVQLQVAESPWTMGQ